MKKAPPFSDPLNYRPISITSFFCRIFERIICRQIIEHCETLEIFPDEQYGFRKHRSRETQMLEVLEHWTTSINDGKPVDVIYFDFAKAFDRVSHPKLLAKLNTIGQSAIDKIADWAEEWQLPLAAHKCNSLHLGRANTRKVYTIHTVNLTQNEIVKDLGFMIQKSLTFSNHCKTIANKAKTACHIILRALRSNNEQALLKAYTVYIRPILESASTVFNPYQNAIKKH